MQYNITQHLETVDKIRICFYMRVAFQTILDSWVGGCTLFVSCMVVRELLGMIKTKKICNKH